MIKNWIPEFGFPESEEIFLSLSLAWPSRQNPNLGSSLL
jgi:hypothetical protein